MVTGTLWVPRSTCGRACLPAPGTLPAAGTVRTVGRLLAVAAVLTLALVAVPVLVLLGPVRQRVVRALARAVLAGLGVRHRVRGHLPHRPALVVANHVSWLDVVVLTAHLPVRLVAKREVRDWPVVGLLAAAAGTVFVDRGRPSTLPATVRRAEAMLRDDRLVAMFPEGTTWCGNDTGAFRPALFQAAIDAHADVAPVSLRFTLAGGPVTTAAAFIGDEDLLSSLRRVASVRGLHVDLRAHPTLHPAPGQCRRALARAAHTAVTSPAP